MLVLWCKAVSLAPFHHRNSGVKAFVVTSVATACIPAHNPILSRLKNLFFFWPVCYNAYDPQPIRCA